MKKRVIVLVFALILCSSVFAIEVDIKETKTVGRQVDDIAPGKLKSTVTRHVYGIGHVADISDGEITYLHQDRGGSTRLITDSEGEVVGEFKSLPFGQEIVNEDVRYSFATGKELDSSGLYYFGARYYDPNVGRFTSVDPVKDNHAYAYVGNNPMNYVDPTGMDEIPPSLMSDFKVLAGGYVEYFANRVAARKSLDVNSLRRLTYSSAYNYGQRRKSQINSMINTNVATKIAGAAMGWALWKADRTVPLVDKNDLELDIRSSEFSSSYKYTLFGVDISERSSYDYDTEEYRASLGVNYKGFGVRESLNHLHNYVTRVSLNKWGVDFSTSYQHSRQDYSSRLGYTNSPFNFDLSIKGNTGRKYDSLSYQIRISPRIYSGGSISYFYENNIEGDRFRYGTRFSYSGLSFSTSTSAPNNQNVRISYEKWF